MKNIIKMTLLSLIFLSLVSPLYAMNDQTSTDSNELFFDFSSNDSESSEDFSSSSESELDDAEHGTLSKVISLSLAPIAIPFNILAHVSGYISKHPVVLMSLILPLLAVAPLIHPSVVDSNGDVALGCSNQGNDMECFHLFSSNPGISLCAHNSLINTAIQEFAQQNNLSIEEMNTLHSCIRALKDIPTPSGTVSSTPAPSLSSATPTPSGTVSSTPAPSLSSATLTPSVSSSTPISTAVSPTPTPRIPSATPTQTIAHPSSLTQSPSVIPTINSDLLNAFNKEIIKLEGVSNNKNIYNFLQNLITQTPQDKDFAEFVTILKYVNHYKVVEPWVELTLNQCADLQSIRSLSSLSVTSVVNFDKDFRKFLEDQVQMRDIKNDDSIPQELDSIIKWLGGHEIQHPRRLFEDQEMHKKENFFAQDLILQLVQKVVSYTDSFVQQVIQSKSIDNHQKGKKILKLVKRLNKVMLPQWIKLSDGSGFTASQIHDSSYCEHIEKLIKNISNQKSHLLEKSPGYSVQNNVFVIPSAGLFSNATPNEKTVYDLYLLVHESWKQIVEKLLAQTRNKIAVELKTKKTITSTPTSSVSRLQTRTFSPTSTPSPTSVLPAYDQFIDLATKTLNEQSIYKINEHLSQLILTLYDVVHGKITYLTDSEKHEIESLIQSIVQKYDNDQFTNMPYFKAQIKHLMPDLNLEKSWFKKSWF